MKKLSKGIALVLTLASASAFAAPNRRLVINELKKLRTQLSLNDSQRNELTLRLADTYADASFEATADPAQAARDRREAMANYQDVMPTLNGQRRVRVGFQTARLLMEDGNAAAARPWFQKALQEAEDTEIRREAALRLAEMDEQRSPKEAEKNYKFALEFCQGNESCTYVHYRLSWIYRNLGRLSDALAEMRLALWDGRGQLRDEAARDLLSLMAMDTSHANAHAREIEALMVKSGQRSLLRDLANAYLSAGNKTPAVEILETIVGREKDLALFIKYLDERYAVGPWEKVISGLEELQEMAKASQAAASLKDPASAEKDALRLAIQLDGDRTTRPERASAFQLMAETFLSLFPGSKDRMRMVEGWLAAEKDPSRKLKRIEAWLGEDRYRWTDSEKVTLLDSHLGVAKKEKQTSAVIADIEKLLKLSPGVPAARTKVREYEYAMAYAWYEKKDFAQALPRFQAIARVNGQPDRFAIQAQNLALDVYNQQKDLASLQKQARLWTENAALRKNSAVAPELAEMRKVADEAEFQEAVAAGKSGAALVKFLRFCEAKRFAPKSCENAKTLALQLEDHHALLRVLQVTGSKDELVSEWEAGGYFFDAAKAREEKLGSAKSPAEYLRVGLLYELALDETGSRRILDRLLKAVQSGKVRSTEEEQLAIVKLLQGSGRLDIIDWTAPAWKKDVRSMLVESLEASGRSTAKSKAFLLAQKASTGPAWERAVADRFAEAMDSERAVKFHTRDSRRKFQERLRRLKSEGMLVDAYAPGSPLSLRVTMIGQLLKSHRILEKEILESPLPAGLDAQQLSLVKSGLADMAKPFGERATQLEALLRNEIGKGKDEDERKVLAGAAEGDVLRLSAAAPVRTGKPVTANRVDQAAYAKAIESLRSNPRNREGLAALRDLFRKSGRETVALYFDGRLNEEGAK